MYEIDCSELPDELATVALDAGKNTIERTPYDTNGVEVLRNTQLIILNGDGRQTDRLYGALRQATLSAVQKYLQENYEDYTDDEYEKYRLGIEFRQA